VNLLVIMSAQPHLFFFLPKAKKLQVGYARTVSGGLVSTTFFAMCIM